MDFYTDILDDGDVMFTVFDGTTIWLGRGFSSANN